MKLGIRLTAVIAVATFLASASLTQATDFDGHVYQLVQRPVCEQFKTLVAWGGDANYWAPDEPKPETWGSYDLVDPSTDLPYTMGLYASQRFIAGSVTLTPGNDPNTFNISVNTEGPWFLDTVKVYLSYKAPKMKWDRPMPAYFPLKAEFDCADMVTSANFTTTVVPPELQPRATTPPTAPKLYFAVYAQVCKCVDNADYLPTITDVLVPVAGATVNFSSVDKNGKPHTASVTTDGDGRYFYASFVWNEAGYFADTLIWVDAPSAVVAPDLTGVSLTGYKGASTTGFEPFIDTLDPSAVVSPNTATPKTVKDIHDVDFIVAPL